MMSFHWSTELLMGADAAICRDVDCELQWDPRVDDRRIGVTCERGILTLSGHVATLSARTAAENVAGRVAGVKAVADRIRISAAADRSMCDPSIAAAASAALAHNITTQGAAVIPIVCNGSVTLKGTVHRGFQKQAAESSMRGIVGVVGVYNAIHVVPIMAWLSMARLSPSLRSTPTEAPT
jgi:osmotically-inducible protein OsmY